MADARTSSGVPVLDLAAAFPGAIILPYGGIWPRIDPSAFIAPGAVVAGDVEVGPGASVWFNATVRGDVAPVRIGSRSNVQDGAVLHVDAGAPCLVGDDVTIGHGAIVHGSRVGDGVTVGMGAVVLSWSVVGAGAIVAAGALVPERSEVDPGTIVAGVPARTRGPIDPRRRATLDGAAARYSGYAANYRAAIAARPWEGTNGD